MTAGRSPFDRTTTAFEVALGHDLPGGRAIGTGANSGIGVPTALALAGCGAEVLLAVRDPANAQPVVERIVAAGGKARPSQFDLDDLVAIEAFAEREGGEALQCRRRAVGLDRTGHRRRAINVF